MPKSSLKPSHPIHDNNNVLKALRVARRRQLTAWFLGILSIGAVAFFVITNLQRQEQEREIINAYLILQDKIEVDNEPDEADTPDKKETSENKAADDIKNKEKEQKKLAENQDHAKKLLDFYEQHPVHPLGTQAGLRAIKLLVELENYPKAMEILEALIPQTRKHLVMQVQLRRTLAGLYGEQGQWEKALAQLEFLEQLPDNPILDENMLMKARVLLQLQRKSEAAAVLDTLQQKVPAANQAPKSFRDFTTVPTSVQATLWKDYLNL